MKSRKTKHNKTYSGKATIRERRTNLNIIFGLFALVFLLSTYSAASDYMIINRSKELSDKPLIATSTTPKAKDITITALPSIYNNEIEFKIRTIAASKGFKWPDYLVCLAFNESSLNPKAISKPNSNGSRDYGLFQFNDKMPPIAITKECSLDLECSTLKAIEAINAGKQDHWTQNEISKRK